VRPHAGDPGPAAPLLYPVRDQGLIGTCQAAQVRGLPGEWLIQFTVGCAFEDPGDLGEQIGQPVGELAEFGYRGVLLVLGELAPSGVVPRCPGELGDEDTVGGRPMILIHLDRIEHAYGNSKSARRSPDQATSAASSLPAW
jgi:hypothetical protein